MFIAISHVSLHSKGLHSPWAADRVNQAIPPMHVMYMILKASCLVLLPCV